CVDERGSGCLVSVPLVLDCNYVCLCVTTDIPAANSTELLHTEHIWHTRIREVRSVCVCVCVCAAPCWCVWRRRAPARSAANPSEPPPEGRGSAGGGGWRTTPPNLFLR